MGCFTDSSLKAQVKMDFVLGLHTQERGCSARESCRMSIACKRPRIPAPHILKIGGGVEGGPPLTTCWTSNVHYNQMLFLRTEMSLGSGGAHTFNPSTGETEAGISLSSRPA